MGRKNQPSAPALDSDSAVGAAAAVAEVGEHPGEPIGTDEAPETTTPPEPVATVRDGEQRPNVVDVVESLKTDVFKLTETVNRLHLVVSGMVNMPEHSSLSRPFAARCAGVLLGNVAIPKIQ